jgi:hypothetical protein
MRAQDTWRLSVVGIAALAGGDGGGHIVLPIDRADAFRARLRSG